MASSSPSLFSQTTFITITSILLLLLSSLSSASTSNTTTHPRPFKTIYAFGDSYTDTGNTESATGPNAFTYVSHLPYGSTYFHHPTNRYSDGRLMIDFVSQTLSLPFLPPYRNRNADKSYGVNFAVAGCTAIEHSFFVKNNLTLNITPQSLGTQLVWFNKFLEGKGCIGATATPECTAVFKDALIWVGEIGANDYAYSVGSSVPSKTIRQLAINTVTGFLQALLKKGAKYLVVQGLPTTGCLTMSMVLASEDDRDDMGCVGSVNKQSFVHNTILQSKLRDLRKQFPHSVIVYADYWNTCKTIIKNAKYYGFNEVFKACCGSGGGPYNFDLFNACGSSASSSCPNPSQFINWDGVHLTEAMYKVVSDSFLSGTSSHPPFDYLLSRKQQSG
ncbi:unnamed protein product [Ilex paraguariensis]|uniref:GDSL esterase/lipase n=1 Tax=Ilex paraguariensis TaxID=185542 RepID=A0ABC8TSW3_9AQUA